MMDSTVTTNAMSSSLLARDVYYVCFPARDGLDVLHGEFAAARKKFFTGDKKAVKVGKNEIVKGFDGKLRGKLTRRSLYWKKTASKVADSRSVALEETFEHKGGHMLVTRDFRSVIVSRVFFDKQMIWLKSEYYEPWDASNARVTFKPNDVADLVERFDWDGEKKRCRSTMLYPVPYLSGTAEQSILNARFGEPQLIVATGEGDFCYCPEQEAEARKRALTDINDGTIVLMPAWEVKDGSLSGEEGEEETAVTFTSLEEYARIEPPKENREAASEKEEAAKEERQEIFSSSVLNSAEDEYTPSTEEERPDEAEPTDEPDSAAILAAAKHAMGGIPAESAPVHAAVQAPEGKKTEDELILEAARRAVASPAPSKDGPEHAGHSGETAGEQNDKAGIEAISAQSPKAEEARAQAGALKAVGPSAAEPGSSGLENAGPAQAPADAQDGPEAASGVQAAPSPIGGYRGTVKDGKLCGRVRTEQPGGFTAYDGEYQDGKRHGFGSYYNRDGNLSYAGLWKEGKKDGLGVSFRDSDHALHIANWNAGQPGEVVSLFDKDGNLRYGGRIVNGKKQGAGVSINAADGTVFVGQWRDGTPTGVGSAYDLEGHLVYHGSWKDGKRNGQGAEFDQNGGIVFDGEWKDGKYHNGILYQKPEQEIPADADAQGPSWDL